MAANPGWEPIFGDALAGSGGMADPVEPTYSSSLAADVFPDALSALPLAGSVAVPAAVRTAAPLADPGTGAGIFPGAGQVQSMPAPPPASSARGPQRYGPPPQQRPWSQLPPPGATMPAPGAMSVPGPNPAVRPGQMPMQYVPVPTSAQMSPMLAPGSSRRPTAGVVYTGPPLPVPGAPIRPPAYLPQGQGLAQVRAAITQARAASARQGGAARTGGAARPSAKKSSGAWGCLVFLAILLVSTGLGQKIVSAVTELLQRK